MTYEQLCNELLGRGHGIIAVEWAIHKHVEVGNIQAMAGTMRFMHPPTGKGRRRDDHQYSDERDYCYLRLNRSLMAWGVKPKTPGDGFPPKKPRKSGRPPLGPEKDRRIKDAWDSEEYEDKVELAREFEMTLAEVKRVLDREAKRRKKAILKGSG